MVAAVPVKRQKLINDRIPAEEGPQVAIIEAAADQQVSAPADGNADYTLQADASPQPNESKSKPVEAAPQTEQIVAVEALPEPKAEPKVAAAEQPESPAADPTRDDSTTQSNDAPLSGWSVQLSSARDEKLAWGTWERLKARHKALGDMKPMVIKADLGTKGIYYRLRVGGFDTQAEAKSACGKLKSRGLTCFVSKADS
jgi:cell division septation protein DedD